MEFETICGLSEHLREINDKGQCLEFCDFENVFFDEKIQKFRFPENLAERYGWGWKRNNESENFIFTRKSVPINMNVIFREFDFYIKNHSLHYCFSSYTERDDIKTLSKVEKYDERMISKSGGKFKVNLKENYYSEIYDQKIKWTRNFPFPIMTKKNKILTFPDEYYEKETELVKNYSLGTFLPDTFYILEQLSLLHLCSFLFNDLPYKIVKNVGISADQMIFLIQYESDMRVAKIVVDQISGFKQVDDEKVAEYEIKNDVDIQFSYNNETFNLNHKAKVMEVLKPLDQIECDFKKMYVDILTFLHNFHKSDYAHFDIKPDNIMFSPRIQKYVLIDFDGSQKTSKFEGWGRMLFTPYYCILNKDIISDCYSDCFQIADLWEFGFSLEALFPEKDLSGYFDILKDYEFKSYVDLEIYEKLLNLY